MSHHMFFSREEADCPLSLFSDIVTPTLPFARIYYKVRAFLKTIKCFKRASFLSLTVCLCPSFSRLTPSPLSYISSLSLLHLWGICQEEVSICSLRGVCSALCQKSISGTAAAWLPTAWRGSLFGCLCLGGKFLQE